MTETDCSAYIADIDTADCHVYDRATWISSIDAIGHLTGKSTRLTAMTELTPKHALRITYWRGEMEN